MARKYKDITTNNKNVKVHITYHDAPNGTVALRGYAVDARTGIRLDGSSTKKRTAPSEAAIPATEQYLVSAVVSGLTKATAAAEKGRTKREIEADHPLSRAFTELRDAPDTLKNRWNDTVIRRWLEYFQRNILPLLMALMIQDTIAAGEDLYDSLREQLMHKGRIPFRQSNHGGRRRRRDRMRSR